MHKWMPICFVSLTALKAKHNLVSQESWQIQMFALLISSLLIASKKEITFLNIL